MALINCPECNKEISHKAKSCPSCGYSMETKAFGFKLKREPLGCGGFIIIGFFLLIIFSSLFPDKEKASQEVQEQKTSNNFSDILYCGVSALNVREGAGTNYKVIGKIKKFDSLRVEKESKGWIYFKKKKFPDGGWVNKKYLVTAQQKDTKVKKEKIKQAKRKAKEKEENCRRDLQCWGDKHNIEAAVYCENLLERLAKYSHEWTDGFLEPKFSRFRWKNINKGFVVYIGDKIRFQNGFGAWQNYIYECDYDPDNEIVLDVRAKLGRL